MRSIYFAFFIRTGIFSHKLKNTIRQKIDRSHIKTMSVVAPEWEGYTNKDGTGCLLGYH